MRGNRRHCHVIHMAAVTQTDCKHSDGHACYQRKLKEGKTPSEARRALKRKISNAIYAACKPTPERGQPRRAREGNRGTTLQPARPAHTPHASSSDQPLPDPPPPYARHRSQGPGRRHDHHLESLDKQKGLDLYFHLRIHCVTAAGTYWLICLMISACSP